MNIKQKVRAKVTFEEKRFEVCTEKEGTQYLGYTSMNNRKKIILLAVRFQSPGV